MSAVIEVDNRLKTMLDRLSHSQLRAFMRELAIYLRKQNRSRIREQRNVDGTRYEARHNKRIKRKMLTGFAKHMGMTTKSHYLAVGIFGNAANLARVHHYGQEDQGHDYASRELIGLSDADYVAIRQMMIKHIGGTA